MSSSLIEIPILTLINAFSVFLIIVVLANSFKDKQYQWFVLMTIFLTFWVDFAYLGYIEGDKYLSVISYRINAAFVSAFIFSAYVFYIERFFNIKRKILKNIMFLVSIIFIILAVFTNTIIETITPREWGNEITFGIMNDFFSGFTLLFAVALICFFISRYFKLAIEEKRKVTYFLIGTLGLVIFNVIFNVMSPFLLQTAKYQHYGDYSAIFFLAFTAFAMLRHKFLGVKVALTAFLISIIGILLIIDIIALSNNLFQQAVKIVIFTFFVGISIILVRSVLSEVKQKEELEKVNLELGKTTDVLSVELKNTQSLYLLTANISKSLDPAKVAQTAVDSLPQDEYMAGAIISLYDSEKKALIPMFTSRNQISDAIRKLIGELHNYPVFLQDSSYAKNINIRAFIEEEPKFSDDLADFVLPAVPSRFLKPLKKLIDIRSLAVYPLTTRKQPVGTITFFLKKSSINELERSQKELLETYAIQIAVALENSNLFEFSQKIQIELAQSVREIQEARRKERDMIDIMGHELRTPMSIVRNAVSMMDLTLRQQGSIPADKLKKYVDIGLESARRESSLIETMLSATKADAKGFQLTFEKVDFVDVVDDSFGVYQKEASKKNIQLIFHKPADKIFVYCDRTRIQEIVDNFISNAVKYTNEGQVEVSFEVKDNNAWLSVKDSGLGISTDDLKLLGRKFFRASQHLQDDDGKIKVIRPGGTGLGLYVAFGLIKIMDGEYIVQSELGKGSNFMFSVPLFTGQELKQVERKVEEYGSFQ